MSEHYKGVLEVLKNEHNLDCSIIDVYDGFNEGVALIRTANSRSLILKTWPRKSPTWASNAQRAFEKARSNGWPTPEWLLIGTHNGLPFCVQEFGQGEPLTVIDNSIAQAIVAANRLQEGHATPVPDVVNYNTRSNTLLTKDYEGWTARVRSHSEAGRAVVEALLARVEDPNAAFGHDLVHGDYGRKNMLAKNGVISAMVDLDNIGWGSRTIDLCDCYRQMIVWGDTESARLIIRHEIEQVVGVNGFYAGLAFKTLSNLSWGVIAMEHEVSDWIAKMNAFVQTDEF